MPFRKRAGGRSGLSVYIPYYCREYRSWRNRWCGDTDNIFRNIGAQEQSAVLSDAYERLSHGYIIAFLYQQVFTYPLMGEVTACPWAEWFLATAS